MGVLTIPLWPYPAITSQNELVGQEAFLECTINDYHNKALKPLLAKPAPGHLLTVRVAHILDCSYELHSPALLARHVPSRHSICLVWQAFLAVNFNPAKQDQASRSASTPQWSRTNRLRSIWGCQTELQPGAPVESRWSQNPTTWGWAWRHRGGIPCLAPRKSSHAELYGPFRLFKHSTHIAMLGKSWPCRFEENQTAAVFLYASITHLGAFNLHLCSQQNTLIILSKEISGPKCGKKRGQHKSWPSFSAISDH